MSEWEEEKAKLQSGEYSVHQVAEWLRTEYNKKSLEPAFVSLTAELTLNRGIDVDFQKSFPLVIWWSRIFLQAWIKDQTLEQALLTYEYPDGKPDLTKNETAAFTVEGDTLQPKAAFQEIVDLASAFQINTAQDLVWQAKENGKVFKFNADYVLMPDGTILKFD